MKAPVLAALLSLPLLATFALAKSGPTFDCAKAKHEIEQLICQNAELAAKDRKLAEVYKQAIAAMERVDAGGPEAVRELKATQRGWIGERNDCWKADNKRQCTVDSYDRRTAYMQARYFLIDGGKPVYYSCGDNAEIVATFIATNPPSVRLERGDSQKIGILSPAGSGSRYDADFGVYFWIKGNEVQVAWPQDKKFSCKKRP